MVHTQQSPPSLAGISTNTNYQRATSATPDNGSGSRFWGSFATARRWSSSSMTPARTKTTSVSRGACPGSYRTGATCASSLASRKVCSSPSFHRATLTNPHHSSRALLRPLPGRLHQWPPRLPRPLRARQRLLRQQARVDRSVAGLPEACGDGAGAGAPCKCAGAGWLPAAGGEGGE